MTRSYRALESGATCVDYTAHFTNFSWDSDQTKVAIDDLEKAIPRLVEKLKDQSLWDRCRVAVGRLPTVYTELKQAVEGAFQQFPARPSPNKEVCGRIATLARMDKAVQKCMLTAIRLRQDNNSHFLWGTLRAYVLVGE